MNREQIAEALARIRRDDIEFDADEYAALDAAIAHLRQPSSAPAAVGVPEGWPTQEMIEAGAKQVFKPGKSWAECAQAVFEAMIAAAPAPSGVSANAAVSGGWPSEEMVFAGWQTMKRVVFSAGHSWADCTREVFAAMLAAAPSAANALPADSVPMCESCDDAATILPNGDTAPCKACDEFFAAQPAAPDSAAAPAGFISVDAFNRQFEHAEKLAARVLELEESAPAPASIETFVVRHYAGDERPTLKGNGFDGLIIGEDREDAEEFVSFVNASLRAAHQPPASDGDVPMPSLPKAKMLIGADLDSLQVLYTGEQVREFSRAYGDARALAALASKPEAMTYTVDGEVMSPQEYISYLHDKLVSAGKPSGLDAIDQSKGEKA